MRVIILILKDLEFDHAKLGFNMFSAWKCLNNANLTSQSWKLGGIYLKLTSIGESNNHDMIIVCSRIYIYIYHIYIYIITTLYKYITNQMIFGFVWHCRCPKVWSMGPAGCPTMDGDRGPGVGGVGFEHGGLGSKWYNVNRINKPWFIN